jgi:Zn finger protein HypA/HybF involved in hydrogenase expression
MEPEIDQSKVFFRCTVCDFVFQDEPNFFSIIVPRCGSEDTERI